MDCVILVQEWPHELWDCWRMETDGAGVGFFWWENAFHCSYDIQSPLIFSCVEWRAEEYLVSASAAWSWHLDQGQACPVSSADMLSPGGNWTLPSTRILPTSLSLSSLVCLDVHIICLLCTESVLHCVQLWSSSCFYSLMALNYASSLLCDP